MQNSARRADLLINAQSEESERRGNPLLETARKGRVGTEQLRRMVQADLLCLRAETTAYGTLLARFPHAPAADFFVELNGALRYMRPRLEACAGSLGKGGADGAGIARHSGVCGAFAFPSAVSWVALNAGQAAAALAVRADFAAYFAACDELVGLLRTTGVEAPQEFFDYYGTLGSQELLDLAADVVKDGLRRGDDPAEATVVADFLVGSLEGFWRFAAGPVPAAAADGMAPVGE